MGRTIYYYQQLESTNLTAFKIAERGTREGTVVLAEHQVRGRGRGSRLWSSPAGLGVYCSIVLQPALSPDKMQLITAMTAVAVAKAVAENVGLSPSIKWPNDILVNGKKVAGILLESKSSTTRLRYVVVGIGINANQTSRDFPKEFRHRASSLRIEKGRLIERCGLINKMFVEMEDLYETIQQGNSAKVLDQWRNLSNTVGQHVRVVQGKNVIEGTAVDIDETGALVVRTRQGSLTGIHAGDVEHLIVLDDVDNGKS